MSRQFWTDFLELYISFPCLWKYSDDDYRNKDARTAAWNELLKKLHEKEPLADLKDLQKKINTYRTRFREVHKQYTISCNSGASPDDVEEPKLWYYYILLPTAQQTYMDGIDADAELDISEPVVQLETDISTVPTGPTTITSQKRSLRQVQDFTKAKRQKILQDLFEVACDVLARPKQHVLPNRFSHMASNVAAILEELNKSDPTQCLLAEKLINDVLYQARLGQLTLDTTLGLSEVTEDN